MSILTDMVSVFAEGVSGIVRDMAGALTAPVPSLTTESRFSPSPGMTVMIHFTGAIQGEFAISLSEETAARLVGSWSDGMGIEDLRSLRGEFGGFLKEALNASVGQAIPHLERQFDALTFLPPVVVYGEIEYPDVPAGRGRVSGDAGEIECFFVLNLAGLGLGERLQAALSALADSTREASLARRNGASMLEAFPTGLVAVDRQGRVGPGYARITPRSVGLGKDAEIAGLHVAELLGIEPCAREATDLWLELVHERWGSAPFKDLSALCPISESLNSRGIVVRPEWFPVPREDGGLESLLLVVEDVTERRRVETEVRKLSRLHEESAELLTQIVNLESDEVQDFVYDSSGLLREAERIVRSGARDRRFIDQLLRTVHALKGSSGQYQFRGLQKLALEIEDEIARLRDQAGLEDAADAEEGVGRIRRGIEEAEGYVRRLEDLRTKLGAREEPIAEKAGRSSPTVMVPLSDIDAVAASVWAVHQAGRSLGWPGPSLSLLAEAAAGAASLRESDFGRMGGTLQHVVSRLAQRLGKKATLSVVGAGSLDIEVRRLMHRCLVHLLGNALDHGIESPAQRTAAGKFETGMIALALSRKGRHVEISLSDDGAGFDPEALRRKAVENGFMDREQAATAPSEELHDLVFRTGFTTRDSAGEFSGRGFGLDVVRDAVLSLGGSIRLESRPGAGSTFRIRLPLQVATPSTRYRAEAEA